MSAPAVIRRNAPRFGSDRAGMVPHARLAGPMPWVIAIMISLTVMAAAAGLALSNLASNAAAEIEGGLTVQIVEGAPAERERQAEIAVAVLSNHEDVIDVLSKQMKQRRESIEHFKAAGRDAMVQVEQEESAIIAEFLPQPLSDDELRGLVSAAIAETGASSPADLGRVMGRLAPQVKGRADGKTVSEMVRAQLGG